MIILAIETSCDDTAIAIVKANRQKFEVLASVISSQIEIHKEYGGVYPTLAVREHKKNLPIVLKKVLKKSLEIDAIAVTIGPGLDPCLWAGINFAKELAKAKNLPVIPVNHLEGHILVNLINKKKLAFPALALIISGGNTQLILVKKIGNYKILGETRDDAVGECFDKTARILGLEYPGGPAIAQKCVKPSFTHFADLKLPRPMINSKDYDFSFSGLKTAVLYNFKNQNKKTQKSQKYISAMCREIQQSAIDVLIKKTLRASLDYGVKSIIVGGGVSANQELRKQFKKRFDNILFPPKKMSTDNAVMIAIAGYYNREKGTKNYSRIKAEPNLRIN